MQEEVRVKKLGVKFSRPALVMIYTSPGKSLHRRTIPVRNITKRSDIEVVNKELQSSTEHSKYLKAIPERQVIKMLTLIKDNMNGVGLDESLEKCKKLETIDPNEDLNKVDSDTLKMKKATMDETFLQNQKKPTDPDFQYDIEVDFPPNDALETLNWSDDDLSEF